MARKVKCHITGDWGTTDDFIKIGKFYYKNQYVYEENKRLKEERINLIDYICRTFLGYNEGQPFPTSLPKKLNELSYYDNAVIKATFESCKSDILYWLEHKNFSSEYGKISYMFAIINNNISDINKKFIRQEKIKHREEANIQHYTDPSLTTGTNKSGKDLSAFLGGDDL
ncbi:MAG: hypothetical protein IJA34_00200 [Lachnospiraceae bacterium]|nr:hypothetical protein [Lachnospiraceae bacterium]